MKRTNTYSALMAMLGAIAGCNGATGEESVIGNNESKGAEPPVEAMCAGSTKPCKDALEAYISRVRERDYEGPEYIRVTTTKSSNSLLHLEPAYIEAEDRRHNVAASILADRIWRSLPDDGSTLRLPVTGNSTVRGDVRLLVYGDDDPNWGTGRLELFPAPAQQTSYVVICDNSTSAAKNGFACNTSKIGQELLRFGVTSGGNSSRFAAVLTNKDHPTFFSGYVSGSRGERAAALIRHRDGLFDMKKKLPATQSQIISTIRFAAKFKNQGRLAITLVGDGRDASFDDELPPNASTLAGALGSSIRNVDEFNLCIDPASRPVWRGALNLAKVKVTEDCPW